MRFGIFRRFSLLLHRRTKSDSPIFPQVAHTISSISLDGLHEHSARVIDTVIPAPLISPLLPLNFSPLGSQQPSPSTVNSTALHANRTSDPTFFGHTVNHPLSRLSAAHKHAGELSTQAFQLKASIEALQVKTVYAEGAARKAKNGLEQVRSLIDRQKQRSAELESQISEKRQELAQCKAFADALSEAGLIALAGSAGSEPARTKEEFEEIAVHAIKEASTDNVGTWSRIVTLVAGPRAPDNYVNAINMTLHARQELRHWKRVSSFWKKTAKEADVGAPTPSSSNLSELRESLSDERKKAVQELREKRKTLGLNALNASTSSGSLASSNESSALPYRLPVSHPSFTSVMSTMSNIESSCEDFPRQSSSRRLPPLASDVFKQELFSSHSSQRLFSSMSQKAPRSSSSENQTKPSDKALGKCKMVDVGDSVSSMPSDVLSFDSNVVQIRNSTVDSSSSNESLSSSVSLSSKASRLGPLPPSQLWTSQTNDASTDITPTHNSLKSAERALESFERICNRFSSISNIGSLQSISEGEESSSASEMSASEAQRSLIVVDSSGDADLVPRNSESQESQDSICHPSTGASRVGDVETEMEQASLPTSNLFTLEAVPTTYEGDVTLVESGSEGSNKGLSSRECDQTLVEVEGLDKEEKLKHCIATGPENTQVSDPSPLKKSSLPIFKIPSRLSQLSGLTGSSSKKSLTSFRSRNSSSSISTQASTSRDNGASRSVKNLVTGLPALKPVLPLRIVKKGKYESPV